MPTQAQVPAARSSAAAVDPHHKAATKLASKFAVFELTEEPPPKTFHDAAEKGNLSMLMRFIERTIDFDINQRDRLQRTALHWAVEQGHAEAVTALLDFGINPLAVDVVGRSAVHLAARTGDGTMLGLLLDRQSAEDREELVNAADSYGITPVFLALQRGEEGQGAFEYLMAHGARYNQHEAPAGK